MQRHKALVLQPNKSASPLTRLPHATNWTVKELTPENWTKAQITTTQRPAT